MIRCRSRGISAGCTKSFGGEIRKGTVACPWMAASLPARREAFAYAFSYVPPCDHQRHKFPLLFATGHLKQPYPQERLRAAQEFTRFTGQRLTCGRSKFTREMRS